MRRAEIQSGVAEVLAALKESGLAVSLGERQREKPDKLDPDLLEQFKQFAIAASRFSSPARSIMNIMDLGMLLQPAAWVAVMTGDPGITWHMVRRITFTQNELPVLLEMLAQRGVDEYVKTVEKGRTSKEAFDVLSLIVLEEESQFSRPQRLIEVLQAGDLLYTNCALLLGESPDRLTVLTCDSGSDKSFDLLGVAKVIEQVKEIILGLWDKVVFFKEKKFAAEIEAITHGLSVFAKVTEMEATGNLGPEQAEIIRRGLTNGCQKFLSAGAIIPEIRDHSHHNPRVLMAPEQKLLMPPAIDTPAPNAPAIEPAPPSASSKTSDEMLERIRRVEEFMAKQAPAPSAEPKTTRIARKKHKPSGSQPNPETAGS